MAVKQLLTEGCLWRIGNGHDVKVQKDPWLPDIEDPLVSTMTLIGMEDMFVKSLMVLNEQRWNAKLTKNMFNNRDSYLILSIPY